MSLSAKRAAFVIEYLKCFRGIDAAQRAGYSRNRNTLAATASRLLKVEEVKDAIQAALDERLMTAEQALARMSDISRAEYAEYITPSGEVDVERMVADGKGYLIKGIKYNSDGRRIVEFYDAQAGLMAILKHHGKLVDRQDITSGGEPITLTWPEQEGDD